MKKYVLFSPVGGHDPIANDHDGALLHICRCYKPEAVYLYLSKEMLERSRMDNRYVAALEKLQDFLHYHIEKIEVIEKEDLKEVQLFDTFYSDFEGTLDEIKSKYPDYEILVNTSSGTPAMKSALSTIGAMSKHKITAIQVSSPNKSENIKKDNPKEFDLDIYWELNEDNTENFENRCIELKQENFLAKIKKETIVQLIKAYDYHAAFTLAKDMREFLNDDAFALISAAKERILLNLRGVGHALNNTDYNIFPIQTVGRKRNIFEYLLYLQIKQKQGNYSDFIRGITPVILNILEECLENQCGIDLKKYCVEKIRYKDKIFIIKDENEHLTSKQQEALRFGNSIYCINIDKLTESPAGMEIKSILEEAFGGSIKESFYSSSQIYPILYKKTDDMDLINILEKLQLVERDLRNITAHQMVSVTDDWIQKNSGMTSKEIMDSLKKLAIKSGIKIKNEDWNSYDEMNKMIEERLNPNKTANN